MKVNKAQLLLLLVGAIALIAVGGALLIVRSGPTPAGAPLQAAVVSSKPAPDFNLALFSGKKITLKDFKGKKPVVINFWASWCPPCREEAPTLAKVSKMYKGKVEFLGIVTNDTQANALAFMKEFGITYDNGIDQDAIGEKYGITGIPETFWIDKRGQIVGHWIGAIDEANLRSSTDKLIQ